MEEKEKKKLHENLKQEIRSLLISSPKTKYGGLTGSLLYFDYKELNCGKEIPYAELGFHSFLSFLRSMPDVVRIECKPNSTSYRVHPIAHHSTEHIQKMVLQQRDKYQQQNKLYNQNWHSNSNNRQYTPLRRPPPHRVYNNYNYNQWNNNASKRPYSKFNQKSLEKSSEDFVILTPSTPTPIEDENISHDQTSSTPNTFRDSPFNCPEIQIDVNELKDSPKDRSPVSLSISSTEDDPKIVSPKEKENEINEDEMYRNRLTNAIRHCIKFRSIHRLCQIDFVYRHYPLTDQTKQMKFQLENEAFEQYKEDLRDFYENPFLHEQTYQNLFNQYIDLQRNYHYMIKILKKNKR